MNTGKSLVLMLCACSCFSFIASETTVDLAKMLDSKGEYVLALETLTEELNSNFSPLLCNEIIDFNERYLLRLSKKITKRDCSYFSPPNKKGFLQNNKANKALVVGGVLAFVINNDPVTSLVSPLLVRNYIGATKGQTDAVRNINIEIPERENVLVVMEEYEVMKKAISTLEYVVRSRIKIASYFGEFDENMKLLEAIRSCKERLKKDRTDYLSFTVLSSTLFEANKCLFLADSDYLALKWRDKEMLDCAVNLLAQAVHKQWLYQADQSVRDQFIEVQTELKKIAKKTELEHYQVVSTLSDCNDTSKKRGPDAWMP